MLCFAATGGTPFGDGDPPSVLYRVVRAAPALDAVPAGLRGLIAACLAKDPADRPGLSAILRACQAHAPQPGDPDYGSASFWPAQVADLIAAHQAARPQSRPQSRPQGRPQSRPQGRPQSHPPRAVSRRRALAGLAVVSAAGLGTAGWALTRSGGGKPAAAAPPSRLLWARDTGGPVTSGAAISAGVVYIGGANGVRASAPRAPSGGRPRPTASGPSTRGRRIHSCTR
jgi:PQQ-like domain